MRWAKDLWQQQDILYKECDLKKIIAKAIIKKTNRKLGKKIINGGIVYGKIFRKS